MKVNLSVAILILVTVHVQSDGVQSASIATVVVGNAGNSTDSTGVGAVNYAYRIGKYEVTNQEYAEFLNGVDQFGNNSLGLYNSNMNSDGRGGISFVESAAAGTKYTTKPGRQNNPVVYVSWYDSVRFINWLHNGKGNGSTENGAYTLLGGTRTPTNGNTVVRNADAKWFLPSDDEWYKAAFHKNDGTSGNYWDFATSSDEIPASDHPADSDVPDASNVANYFNDDGIDNGFNDGHALTRSPEFEFSNNYLTDVGQYHFAVSPYGTYDQSGNAWEWVERSFNNVYRGVRGGGATLPANGMTYISSAELISASPASENGSAGFRVAAYVPEPSSLSLILVASAGILRHRRVRTRNASSRAHASSIMSGATRAPRTI